MRNRVLTFLLGFLSLSLAAFAQDTSLGPGSNPGRKFVPKEGDYDAPTRVMNYNSETGDVDLTYYINDRRQLFNMCSDNGTFTNVTFLDGGTTGKVTEKNTPVSAFNSQYPDGLHLVWLTDDSVYVEVPITFTEEEQSAMQPGGKIVVRGIPDTGAGANPQIKIVADNDWDHPITNETGEGYVAFTGEYDVDITEDNLDALKKGIHLQGQDYTLTGLTISSAQENPYHFENTVGWSTTTPDSLTWGSEETGDPKAYGIHVTFDQNNNAFWNRIVSGSTLRFEFTDVEEGAQVQVSTYLNGVVDPDNFINLTDNGGLSSVTISKRDQNSTGYYEISINTDGQGGDAIDLVKNYGVYVKGQDAKLKEISVYYKVNEENLGDNYIFLATYSQTYNQDGWDPTTIKPYYAPLGKEENHRGGGKWEDRALGGEYAKPTDWQGNNIRSVTVYCKDGYQMNTSSNYGDGDQQMINGLHPRLLDLTKADVGVEYAQWFTSNPEVDAYKHGENLHKLMDVVLHNHTRLVKVRLPENVEAIGYEAFSDCPNLTEVHIPHCTKVIGNNAFGNCPKLTTLKVMRDTDPWGDFNFVQFPKALEYIGNRAFQNDRSLRFTNANRDALDGKLSFYIGDNTNNSSDFHYNLKEIGDIAFLNCVNLADTIYIPNTVTRIGQGAFRNTTNEAGTIQKIVFNYTPQGYATGVQADTLEIGQYAFSQQPSLYIPDVTWYDRAPLKSVIFDPGQTYAIDAAAFQYDVNLNDLGLSAENKNDVKFTRVGARAFEHCHSLASDNNTVQNIINNVTVTNGRPAIGNNAFAYCNGGLLNTKGELISSVWNSWYEITIPDSWKYLPAGLFEHDFNLINVNVSATEAPVTENTLNDADKANADLGQSIALTDGSYGTNNEDFYTEHGGQYIIDEGATLHYPFYGIVSNRCRLNFTFENWDEPSKVAKNTYRAQPGFLYDLLTKYLDEDMIHHETKSKDGKVILRAWDDTKMDKYYYCVDQTAADIVLNRTFNKDANNWNTVALPFGIWNKDTYTNALGSDAVAALYALDKDEPLRKDGKTLHFVQIDWGSDYPNIPEGTPFVARHIDTSKAQPTGDEPTEYFYATLTKNDGGTVQATATKPVQGYRFANVDYYGANWPNYNEPAYVTETRENSPYAFVGSYILHSKTGLEPISGIDDPSYQDNRIENAFFIQNNKFYSTDQIGDKKLSLKGFRAYFTKSETAPTTAKQSVLDIGLDESEATGIEQAHIVVVNPDGSSVDKAYNLEGQRVSDGYKGVVIVNGKKMIRR